MSSCSPGSQRQGQALPAQACPRAGDSSATWNFHSPSLLQAGETGPETTARIAVKVWGESAKCSCFLKGAFKVLQVIGEFLPWLCVGLWPCLGCPSAPWQYITNLRLFNLHDQLFGYLK